MVKTLANKIRFAYQNYDSIFIYVVGRVGAGKTSFALHLLREVYNTWNILDYVFFDLKKFLEKAYRKISCNRRYIAIVLDDAGATLNALRFREQEMLKIIEIFNFMRSICSGIIFTTPDVYDVLKRIRVKAMFIAQVFPLAKERSIARIYETRYSAGYDKYYRKFITEIEYPRHYPIHSEYIKKRNSFIRKRMREILNKKERKISYYVGKTICPKCHREGYMYFRMIGNKVYVYIMHGRNGECYLGNLNKNKELLVEIGNKISINR